MKRTKYYVYEGNEIVGREEQNGSDDKAEAILLAKNSVQNARDMGFTDYVAHVIIRKTGEFIFSDSI